MRWRPVAASLGPSAGIAGAGGMAAVALFVAAVVLAWGRPAAGDLPAFGPLTVLELVPFVAYGIVGALVAARRADNPMGWLLLLIGVAMTGQIALEEYTARAIVLHPGSLPAAAVADWASEWLWIVPLAAMQFTPLLFPDGRLPSRRWRWFVWPVAVGDVVLAVGVPLALWPLRGTISTARESVVASALGALEPLVGLLVLAVPVSLLSLIARYRGADSVQRYQLRWLAFAAALLAGGMAITAMLTGPLEVRSVLADLPVAFAEIALPVTLAFAVLRRNLFDLGRVVSRTVSYLLLTGVLVGVYALGVLGVGALLPGEPSDVLVAGSTLVAAALFRPMRSRIQALVDRHFNRSRYDAVRTLEVFGARLRDEIEITGVMHQLEVAAVVALQPSAFSVWLVPDEVPT